ncbi:MAG TPA: patatin-like phospholipase family protein [Gaiellaceae bacterium]|nr:patatin-like phospholipase family protein [Gaiellaceae bacterium]
MARSPLFEGIPDRELDSSLRGLERRRMRSGTVLAAEGDYLAEMYVLRSGSVEIVVGGGDARAQVVARLGPGETIGEMSLLTREPASVTVRAVDDVELLVLKDDDLEALMERLPRIPRNIIGILSARLTRMTRLAARERPGKVVALENRGAAEVPGYALASSIAWHTRAPTLHVLVTDDPPPALAALATTAVETPFRPRREGGADLMIARPEDGFDGPALTDTLERLARAFDYVLVEAPSWPRRAEAAVALRSSDWQLPELEAEEERALSRGLLPTTGAAGRAVGPLARELAQLKVGIALGSGSVRGYAHVGVLRRLETLGVPIDCLAGTSIGAIVAGLYAYFQDTERVADFLDELGARMFRPTVSRKSLLSTRAMRNYIRKVIGDGLIEDVPIPVAFVATDVDTHEEVVLRRGSGVTALFASCAVPGVFPAVRVGNRRLVDGGIVNPVPASVAAQLGAGVVVAARLVSGGGVDLDTVSEEGEGPIPSAVSAIVRSFELVQTRITASAGPTPTVMITPQFDDLPAAKLRRFREGRRYIPAGEAAVDAALPRLQAALPWLRD